MKSAKRRQRRETKQQKPKNDATYIINNKSKKSSKMPAKKKQVDEAYQTHSHTQCAVAYIQTIITARRRSSKRMLDDKVRRPQAESGEGHHNGLYTYILLTGDDDEIT